MKKIIVNSSTIEGRGIFATTDMAVHDYVGCIKGPIKHKVNFTLQDSLNNPDWVGFKKNYWIDPQPPFKYINHSCNPNCGIKGARMIYAIRPIKKGDELTFDYSTSEIDQNWKLECKCKSSNCRKLVSSIQTIPKSQLKKYLPYIPTGFKKYI